MHIIHTELVGDFFLHASLSKLKRVTFRKERREREKKDITIDNQMKGNLIL